MKRRGSTPFKKLVARIDEAHSLLIRKTIPVCQLCGQGPVEPCHIFSRNHFFTRWDLPTMKESNVIGACRRCHNEDHAGKGIFKAWFIKKYGDVAWDRLAFRANCRADYTVPVLQDLLASMRRAL